MATEEPKFDLIKKTQNYEIRNYSDRPSIQTIKNSGEDTAFRRLFEYISGSNSTSSKINMTAPVIEFEDVNSVFLKTFTPPEADSKKFYESLKMLSYNNTYFGELKKPQPPWPKQHSI